MNIEWFNFFASLPVTYAVNYNSESSVGNDTCIEGGQDVGFISSGSWTEYNNVNLNGVTTFYARAAGWSGGSTISIHLDSPTGTLIGTCPVPNTGNYQNWADTSCALTGASGTHNLYLVYGANMNMQWFSFALPAVGVTEAASDNSASGGVTMGACSEGGLNLGTITNGSYSAYNGVQMTGVVTFNARVASAGSGGNIVVHLDSPTGTVVGTATVPVTGGWQNWTTVSCNLTASTGFHNLYLVYTGGGGNLFNVEWFQMQY